jgi:hypothetical protein
LASRLTFLARRRARGRSGWQHYPDRETWTDNHAKPEDDHSDKQHRSMAEYRLPGVPFYIVEARSFGHGTPCAPEARWCASRQCSRRLGSAPTPKIFGLMPCHRPAGIVAAAGPSARPHHALGSPLAWEAQCPATAEIECTASAARRVEHLARPIAEAAWRDAGLPCDELAPPHHHLLKPLCGQPIVVGAACLA